MSGITATTEACDFALSSTVPPTCDLVAFGQACVDLFNGWSERAYSRLGELARAHIGLHGQGGNPVAPPDHRIFLLGIEPRDLAERNDSAIGQRNFQGSQRGQRNALLIGRPADDIDEIDIVAQLRHGHAYHDAVQHRRDGS